MATRLVLAELVESFQQQTGSRVLIESVGGVDAAKRVQACEAFDVVILASDAIDKLMAGGCLLAGSKVDLMRSGVAVAVRAGTAPPDISTEKALRETVRGARSLSYSTGPSGVALAQLFERWGIADEIKNRIVQVPPGVPVGTLVARGEVALGFQQFSELMHLEGITVVGPLPASVQVITTFSAAICVGSEQCEPVRKLLEYMNSAQATVAKISRGMEPTDPPESRL
jgi:molybdate transport system substrate-binding protein